MQEKEMFLQKINKKILYFLAPFLFIVFLVPNQSRGNQDILSSQISNYFFKINNFTSKFIQSDASGIQEGSIYLSNKIRRIKIIARIKRIIQLYLLAQTKDACPLSIINKTNNVIILL